MNQICDLGMLFKFRLLETTYGISLASPRLPLLFYHEMNVGIVTDRHVSISHYPFELILPYHIPCPLKSDNQEMPNGYVVDAFYQFWARDELSLNIHIWKI